MYLFIYKLGIFKLAQYILPHFKHVMFPNVYAKKYMGSEKEAKSVLSRRDRDVANKVKGTLSGEPEKNGSNYRKKA